MKVIRIKGMRIPITLTVRAFMDICELCGGVDKLKDWLGGDKPTDRLKKVITIMAEASQRKNGLKVKPLDFPLYLNSAEIIGAYFGIFSEIEQAMYHEIPPKVKTQAAVYDRDLDYVLDRRAKDKGLKRPNKALSTIARGLECGLSYSEILDMFTPGEIMQIWLYQLEMKGGSE